MQRPDRVGPHRAIGCRCVITTDDGHRYVCEAVAVPDSPFCVGCLDRHPDLVSARVTVVPVERVERTGE
jgi:hypothetical protein